MASATVVDHLAEEGIDVLSTKLAALRLFSRDFSTDPRAPRSVVQVRKATTASAVQSNPTNFEVGDTTVAAIEVTPNQISKSFHISNDELNKGHRLRHLARINANVFADAISDVWTALLIAANYPTPVVVGAAAAFDSDELATIMAAAKNFGMKNLILDGGHLAYLLPRDKVQFKLGEQGAYGFDRIAEQNRWTGAVANTVGFIAGPDAIAVASGLPVSVNAGDFIEVRTVTVPGLELSVALHVWYARNTRSHWASFDVVFGAAVGDATQAEILVIS